MPKALRPEFHHVSLIVLSRDCFVPRNDAGGEVVSCNCNSTVLLSSCHCNFLPATATFFLQLRLSSCHHLPATATSLQLPAQNNLPDMLAAFHQAVCIGGFIGGEDGIYYGFYLSRYQQGPYCFFEMSSNGSEMLTLSIGI